MFFGFIALIMICTFAYAFSAETQWHDNRILCVSLDEKYAETKEVEQLIKARKHTLYRYLGMSLLGCIVYPMLQGYALLYACLHIFATFAFYRKWGRDSQAMLKALKAEEHWHNLSAKQIRVDTKLSKNHLQLPKGKLLFPIIFMIIVFLIPQDSTSRGVGCLLLCMQASFLHLIVKTRGYAYCDDYEVNAHIRLLQRRVMIQSYLWMGFLFILDQVFLMWKITEEIRSLFFLFLFSIIHVCVCVSILALLKNYHQEKKQCLSFQKKEVVEEDEFWSFGLFGPKYHNPYDPRWFRTISRSGQYCLNGAKPLVHSASIVCAGVMLGLLVWYDLLPTIYHSQKNLVAIFTQSHQVVVDSPFYQHTFPIGTIDKVEYREEIGKGRRTNGFDNTIYATGQFIFDAYGKAHVYIVDDTHAYILLYTTDGLYVINTDTVAKTKTAYDDIKQELGV